MSDEEINEMLKDIAYSAEMQDAKRRAMVLLQAFRTGPDALREELKDIGTARVMIAAVWGTLFNLNWFFERWVEDRKLSGEFEDPDQALEMFITMISNED